MKLAETYHSYNSMKTLDCDKYLKGKQTRFKTNHTYSMNYLIIVQALS